MEDQPALDQSAVEAVLQGDNEAFGALVTRYQRMVAGIAWRYGFRPEDVEDIVSEVFTKTFRNLHLYRPDHAFSTWLYRLAVNHVVDRTRRAKKEQGRTEMPEQVVDPAARPGEDAEARERAVLVRGALEGISPRYREAIQLIYIEGLKIDEASRTLGVPTGTIKTRLMRGREALRKALVRRHPGCFEGDDAV
jgi:RNA polymerase sigma-70 factor (ECF subfamily)